MLDTLHLQCYVSNIFQLKKESHSYVIHLSKELKSL